MRVRAIAMAALLAGTVQAPAGAADSWGLEHERELVLEGKVVDIACELTGDCPEGCGRGWRQLGLLSTEGRLYLAAKGATLFAGASLDLLPFCGATVQADGLLIEHPQMPLYFAQRLRAGADQPWQPTDAFERAWTLQHGPSGDWIRADPQVQATIAERGVLGIPGLKPE